LERIEVTTSRKGTFEIPLIVRCLKDKIAEWDSVGGTIRILPKDASFNVLKIQTSRPISTLFETLESFECVISVKSEGETSEKDRGLYQRLKGMECELEHTGILRKKFLFAFQPQPPYVEMNNRLIEALTSDNELLNMIRDVRLEEFAISLYYRAPLDVYAHPSKEKVLTAMAEYYQNPKEIVWIIAASKVIPRFTNYRSITLKIYNLLDLSSQIVRRVTKETEFIETY
jgi:hypothetical protein